MKNKDRYDLRQVFFKKSESTDVLNVLYQPKHSKKKECIKVAELPLNEADEWPLSEWFESEC